MSLLFYFPESTGPGEHLFRSAGLESLLGDGKAPDCTDPKPGPDGKQGCFATLGDVMTIPDLGYLPNRQSWRPARPCPKSSLPAGRFWLGRFNDLPVAPPSLARDKQYASQAVKLADSQAWMIPIARQLPHVWGLAENGEFAPRPREEFAAFCLRSESIYEHLTNGGSMSLSEAWGYACAALALNYRVTPDMVDFLALIDTVCGPNLIAATVEMEAIITATEQKKSTESAEVPAI
jgi:hypothetical protein